VGKARAAPPNNSMQRAALRAAADAERWADILINTISIDNMHECTYDGAHGI